MELECIPEPTHCEAIVETTLSSIRLRYVREKRYQCPILGSIFVDFYIPPLKLVLEVDGPSHDDVNQQLADRVRDSFHVSCGRRICRIRNEELMEHSSPTDVIIDRLLDNGYLSHLRVLRTESTMEAVTRATEQTFRKVDRAYVVARNTLAIDQAVARGLNWETSEYGRAHHLVGGCGWRYHITTPIFSLDTTSTICSHCSKRIRIKGGIHDG